MTALTLTLILTLTLTLTLTLIDGWKRDRDAEGNRVSSRMKQDGSGFRLSDFVKSEQAKAAKLTDAHVLALRLYVRLGLRGRVYVRLRLRGWAYLRLGLRARPRLPSSSSLSPGSSPSSIFSPHSTPTPDHVCVRLDKQPPPEALKGRHRRGPLASQPRRTLPAAVHPLPDL